MAVQAQAYHPMFVWSRIANIIIHISSINAIVKFKFPKIGFYGSVFVIKWLEIFFALFKFVFMRLYFSRFKACESSFKSSRL